MEYKVYVDETTNFKEDIMKGLEFIDWKNIIEKDSTVFLKPNLTLPYYQEGVTTNPKFLKALLEIIKDRADRVIVGESDGGNHQFTANDSFEGHGLNEMCNELGIDLVNLSELPSKYVEDTILGKTVKVLVPEILLNDVDCFISVPVLKVHVMTGVTLGMKNLWGCYPDTMRCMNHKNLDHKLTLLTKLINPKIVVIDGTYALDGHGPMFGDAVNSNLLLIANNPVASDLVGANMMGMPPKLIKNFLISGTRVEKANHIAVASEEGLGPKNLDEIQINQDWMQFKRSFKLNKTLMDKFCVLPFNSKIIAKLVFDSAFQKTIFKLSDLFIRNNEELDMVDKCKKYNKK